VLINIDPGVKAAGVAVFEDGELSSAWLARGKHWQDTARNAYADLRDMFPLEVIGPETTELVIERMQIYPPGRGIGDQNDLVTVAFMSACLAGYLDICPTEYYPAVWKGQTPKKVMNDRVLERLSEGERSRIYIKKGESSLKHNVIDAVGIGLYHLKRRHRDPQGL